VGSFRPRQAGWETERKQGPEFSIGTRMLKEGPGPVD
jgi:hypothetical protein